MSQALDFVIPIYLQPNVESYTLNISNYEFFQFKKSKFEISRITPSGCKYIGIRKFEFVAKLNSFLRIGLFVSHLGKHFKPVRNYIVLIIEKSVSRIMLNTSKSYLGGNKKNYSDEIKRIKKNHFVPEKEKHTQK